MKLLRQESNQCLITSFAMLIDKDVKDIVKDLNVPPDAVIGCGLGHQPHPRSYHIDELQEYVNEKFQGFLVSYDARPTIAYVDDCRHQIYEFSAEERFLNIIKDRKALLLGRTENNVPHAYAWDGSYMYDPRGMKFELIFDRIDRALVLYYL